MRPAPVAVALVFLAAVAPQAHAQFCGTSYCSRYESGECVETTTAAPCSYEKTGPTYSYGAIAYGNNSRAFGYSYSWSTKGQAVRVAMKNCSVHGNDCEVTVWFEHKCGAVAAGDGIGAFWGLGNATGAATADALGKCKTSGTKNCAIQVSQCSR